MSIRVNGYFVVLHCPTPEALNTITVDARMLSPREFHSLIVELEDYLSDVDDEYRMRRSDAVSRRIHGKFIKIPSGRKRILRFSPYPNRFKNITNIVRTAAYDTLNSKAIVIQNIRIGVFRRNIYLLPHSEADSFLRKIDDLNEELEELKKLIEDYHEKGYYNKVLEILDKYNVEYDAGRARIEKIIVNMLPIVIDPEVIKPYISERAAREIEEMKRRIVEEAIKDAEKKIKALVQSYIAKINARKFNPERAAKQLEELKERINSLGVVDIDPIITPLIDLCHNPQRLVQEALKTVDTRVKALLKTI
jgi:hypothetical protein